MAISTWRVREYRMEGKWYVLVRNIESIIYGWGVIYRCLNAYKIIAREVAQPDYLCQGKESIFCKCDFDSSCLLPFFGLGLPDPIIRIILCTT